MIDFRLSSMSTDGVLDIQAVMAWISFHLLLREGSRAMLSFLRSVLAVFVGLVVGFVSVAGVEMLGFLVSPPPGIDHSKMATMPAGVFVPIMLAWAAGTFAGAWVAARIAPRWKLGHGLIIGGLFLAATLGLLLHIPHPAWVWVVGLAEIVLVGYLGARLASRDRSTPSVAA
jgi:hypothetical protein